MTLGHIASQMAAKAVASDTVAHKWQVFQHIRESRGLIGATDRSLDPERAVDVLPGDRLDWWCRTGRMAF